MNRLQKIVSSLMMTVITSILLYITNWIILNMTDCLKPGSLPLFPKRMQAMNSYESQIANNIIKPEAITERLQDVGGLREIKDEIKAQILLPLRFPKIFFADVTALHPPRGVLFYGPPGTGKTMLAKAIAAEANCPFLSLTLSSLENKYFGESSKLLGATFSLARKIQPCLIFFDEIDGMIRTRSDMDQSCVYGFKTEFLTHMDGINTKNTDAVIVIGCTNCANKLDPAIKRRLAKQYKVDLPTNDEIVDIFMLNLANTSVTRNDIEKLLLNIRPGCSGSDVVDIVRSAWNLQMLQYTSSPQFVTRLQEEASLSAQDVQRLVGNMKLKHVIHALEKKGLWVVDDEEPPPEEEEEVSKKSI